MVAAPTGKFYASSFTEIWPSNARINAAPSRLLRHFKRRFLGNTARASVICPYIFQYLLGLWVPSWSPRFQSSSSTPTADSAISTLASIHACAAMDSLFGKGTSLFILPTECRFSFLISLHSKATVSR
ncbi:hypothetical protein C8R45DRAFT_1217223, partial [Mycena sanguinolenta]